ncbi:Six-hairpin glycosidase-like protein [Phellopilus nigrolimitatus]|nr:Six-hairpin glycosidase-like protein [Phellopilus nigrolimitatus]
MIFAVLPPSPFLAVWVSLASLLVYATLVLANTSIDRRAIVSRYNPTRNASSTSTPIQVGNGNFAFGTDVTGLQTFQPFAIMSSWGWKNDTFPVGRTLDDILAYKGTSLDNHGRNVSYMYGGVADIQQWLISNPNRVNLGQTGLLFLTASGDVHNVTEADLKSKKQTLDLWTGQITSTFSLDGSLVNVTTLCAQDSDTVGIKIDSELVSQGRLGLFLDFPWNDGSAKFSAPFVGLFNMTSNHTTNLIQNSSIANGARAEIIHTLVNNSFVTSIGGSPFNISRDSPNEHRYSVLPSSKSTNLSITVSFALQSPTSLPGFNDVQVSSIDTWNSFWSEGGFIDVYTASEDSRADELQRRIILSQYLLRVNEAGDYPPQESGLVNNGWYGKFHMEMFYWHSIHWALWSQWELLHRSSSVYSRFLATSIARAQVQQSWPAGARWSKMTDPSGRSAPGEINELLIWQQVHPLVFAEYEYRAFPNPATLEKWRDVVRATADWMSVFAFRNVSTNAYDIGPPMYVVSEDTDPLVTRNPAFELAYWNFGLLLAETWMERLGEKVPALWGAVRSSIVPLPIADGTYSVYEGIESDFWNSPAYTNDHPALVGLYGWLPETPSLNVSIAKATMEKVWTHWNISNCWGWDFGMLAMSAARNDEPEQAVSWLLNDVFSFDDVGMPTGGTRAPTPYFPGSGGLLLAVAMMAEGWDGSKGEAPGFRNRGG